MLPIYNGITIIQHVEIKMKNTLKAILVMSFLAHYSSVKAQGIPFEIFDKNMDGAVSEQEFNEAKATRMGEMAAQGRQMRGLSNAPTFDVIDSNKDGKLTPEEIQAFQKDEKMIQGKKAMGRPAPPVFSDFDLNNDKVLSEQEYNESRNKRIAARAIEGRQMRGLANIAAFADIDTNGNNRISELEFELFLKDHMQKGH